MASDVVIDWNNVALDRSALARRRHRRLAQSRHASRRDLRFGECDRSRPYASYAVDVLANPLASRKRPSQRARTVLSSLFPSQTMAIDSLYNTILDRIPNGKTETDGVNLGIALRSRSLLRERTMVRQSGHIYAAKWSRGLATKLHQLLPPRSCRSGVKSNRFAMTTGNHFHPVRFPP